MELDRTFTAKVLHAGKITIPIELRELHGIQEDDLVTVTVAEVNKKR